MHDLLMRAFVSATALLVTASPAYARSFAAVIDCEGVWAPGDDVPFDVLFEELDGKADKVFVSITLEVPGDYNNQLVASGVVRLEAGETRAFSRFEHLPLKAPVGSYSMFMNASSENGTEITICDFTVE